MIFLQLKQQLESLHKLLLEIRDDQYNNKISHLSNSSIGAHTRHVIELLQCTLLGYEAGKVDYLNRQRNLDIEQDRLLASAIIEEQLKGINKQDKNLLVICDQSEPQDGYNVKTTYFREIIFNTEHAIHHLAFIKVALIEMQLPLVSKDFGLAYSTIKYQESLVNHNA